MKEFLIFIVLVLLLSSCGVSYQVFYMEPEKSLRGERLVYENRDIKVGYDLWCEGGNSGFAVYNKTDKPIYVDLENSHFVLNGVAHTYFQNTVYTTGSSVKTRKTSSFGASNTNTSAWGSGARYGSRIYSSSMGYASDHSSVRGGTSTSNTFFGGSNEVQFEHMSSMTVAEKRIITIPPKSMKIFPGFPLNNSLYNPKNFAWETYSYKTFNKRNTLIDVKNIVSYRFKESEIDSNILFENALWLKKIANYRKKDINSEVSNNRNFFISYKKQNL